VGNSNSDIATNHSLIPCEGEEEHQLKDAKESLGRIETEETILKALEEVISTGYVTVVGMLNLCLCTTHADAQTAFPLICSEGDPKIWDHSTISTTQLETALAEAAKFGFHRKTDLRRLEEGAVTPMQSHCPAFP